VTSALLETKLYVPKLRRAPVPRGRLSDRLREGTRGKLTLISAPAGFGKTTLLAEWVGLSPVTASSTAWLSLDAADDQPASFWAYLITALQGVVPGVGATALALLQEGHPPPIDAILGTLLNDLASAPDEIVLVLDDYHVVDGPAIQDGMTYLLEHLPARLHLVIATRADPALPMARLRAQGELVEIRAVDLRFTPDEATEYLNDGMGLDLAAQEIAALEGRTEGWIAALQLAALSIQGREDMAGFIAGFAGDDRYIVDYLVEEVLHRQPDHIRSFLLETSILGRLTGSLCDAVTAQDGGKATLESLDRGNLFLVPLDDRRQWYRYHHLFADVLRARLLDERPDRVASLHRRATEWFERNGDRSEAIRHALAGGDFDRAADLIELAIPTTRRQRQEGTLRQWLEALPDETIGVRPVLINAFAGSRLVRSEVEGVESRLRDAERWLDATGDDGGPPARPPGMVVADEEQFRALRAAIAVHRSGLSRLLGDVSGSVAYARRALDLVGADDQAGRGAAMALLGLAYWTTGDLDAAHQWYSDGMAVLEKAGYLSDLVGSAIIRADIRTAQGRLREALRIYERGLQVATERPGATLRGAADMHVGMSELLRERNDLDAAREHLVASQKLGEPLGLPQHPCRSLVARAGLAQAEGDLDAAVHLLEEAERLYVGDYSPDVRPVAATKARMWIAQGRLAEAADWARDRGIAADDDLSHIREFEHITLARLILAQATRGRAASSIGEAIELLERLMAAAEEGGRNGSLIDILVVRALASRAVGDDAAALASLSRAIDLAEPEGYVRLFLDEGSPMTALLRLAAKQPGVSGYVRRLLAAGGTEGRNSVAQPLVEPLSERELEVLRLLDSDLSGPGIARELTVALATVRTHTQSVYAKLGVNSRRAAVQRGSELGLLSRARVHPPDA
jgi:LuxR family maltose regulon positive regulatory protein